MLQLFKKHKLFLRIAFEVEYISKEKFIELKEQIVSLAIDELNQQEVKICKHYFEFSNPEKDLIQYNDLLLKSKIIDQSLKFEKDPLKRLL